MRRTVIEKQWEAERESKAQIGAGRRAPGEAVQKK